MTDWETAIAHWLPEVWTPKPCKGRLIVPGIANVDWWCIDCHEYFDTCVETHYWPCPPATPELGFRLLEAIHKRDIYVCFWTSGVEIGINRDREFDVFVDYAEGDLLTAIVKAAAALAKKEQS